MILNLAIGRSCNRTRDFPDAQLLKQGGHSRFDFDPFFENAGVIVVLDLLMKSAVFQVASKCFFEDLKATGGGSTHHVEIELIG